MSACQPAVKAVNTLPTFQSSYWRNFKVSIYSSGYEPKTSWPMKIEESVHGSNNGNNNTGNLSGNLNGINNTDGTNGNYNGNRNIAHINGNKNGRENQGTGRNGNFNGNDNAAGGNITGCLQLSSNELTDFEHSRGKFANGGLLPCGYNGNNNGNFNNGTGRNGNGNGNSNIGFNNGNVNGNGQHGAGQNGNLNGGGNDARIVTLPTSQTSASPTKLPANQLTTSSTKTSIVEENKLRKLLRKSARSHSRSKIEPKAPSSKCTDCNRQVNPMSMKGYGRNKLKNQLRRSNTKVIRQEKKKRRRLRKQKRRLARKERKSLRPH